MDKKSYDGEKPVRLCNYTDVYYRNSIDHADGLMASCATELEIKEFSLKKGDVFITLRLELRCDR